MPPQAAAADASANPQYGSGLPASSYWLHPAAQAAVAEDTAVAAAFATVGSPGLSAGTAAGAPPTTNNTDSRSDPIPLLETEQVSMHLLQEGQSMQFEAHEVISLFEGTVSVEAYPELAAAVREHRDRLGDMQDEGQPIPSVDQFLSDTGGAPEDMLVDDSEMRDSLAGWENLFHGVAGPQYEGGPPVIPTFPIDVQQGNIPIVTGIPIQQDDLPPLVFAEQGSEYVDPETAMPIQDAFIPIPDTFPVPLDQHPGRLFEPEQDQPPLHEPAVPQSATSGESTQDMLDAANREIAQLRQRILRSEDDRHLYQAQSDLQISEQLRRNADANVLALRQQLLVERERQSQLEAQVRRLVAEQQAQAQEWMRVTERNAADQRYTNQRMQAAIRQLCEPYGK